jgi:hypothetical protein
MKSVSAISLAAALALGVAGGVVSAPAFGKKEEAPKVAAPKLSDAFKAQMVKAEAAAKAKDAATLEAILTAAAPLATLPDDKFFLGAKRIDLGKLKQSAVLLRQGLNDMLGSGSGLMQNRPNLLMNAGNLAYQAKDYPDAIAKLTELDQLGQATPDTNIEVANAYFIQKQYAAGVPFARKALAGAAKSPTPADVSWFRLARQGAYQANLPSDAAEFSRMLITAYPNAGHWHDALGLQINALRPGDELRLDMFRLMREAKSLGGRDEYRELSELLLRLQLPGEAKSVLDEAAATGVLKPGDGQLGSLMTTANGLIAADRASLSQGERGAKASDKGSVAARWANVFLGYGENAKAAELYKLALQKGQVDTNMVNYRLGLALGRSGQKAEAAAALNSVTGSFADLAKFAALWFASKP